MFGLVTPEARCIDAADISPVITNSFDFSPDGILALLRSQGLRITRSRRGIVLALFRAERPVSLLEIQSRALVEGGVLPDYATVFRMMILLENLKLVHKVNLRRSCSYYELTDPSRHQDHLVCTQCGEVITLAIPFPAAEMRHGIEREFGYSGLQHSLEFFGRCPDCTRSVSRVETSANGALPVPA